jgi:peptide/nickel transport system substrate-binding protein
MVAWLRLVALVGTFATVACGQPSSRGAEPAPGAQPAAAPARTLVAAVKVEPATIAARQPQETAGVGLYFSDRVFNANIALNDFRGTPMPYLVEALPKLNSDDWRLFPDGTMETTFRLRPGLAWHDGTPLSAEDFVFSWRIYSRSDLGAARRIPMEVMESVTAPDARTLVIRWKRAYPDAGTLTDRNAEFPPLPRHLLQQTWDEGSGDMIVNHPYWHREFVGAGPFRLDRWEPGAFIEASAFDKHALGTPKIARLRIVFISDSPTVVANLISGEIHLAAVDALRLDQALTLKRDWEQTRAGDMRPHANQWRAIHFQFRPDIVNPKALLNPAVRKALAYAVDRHSINEAVYGGTLEISDGMISGRSEWGEAISRTVTRYDFDLRRSEQLMAQAGFSKAGGVYTSPAEGRFGGEIKTNAAADNEQEMQILASGWREAGFGMTDAILPIAQAQDNEVRATFPTMFSNNGPLGEAALLAQSSTRIPGPDNRWNGSNRGGWLNADYDRLLESFGGTLDRAQRAELAAQMVRLYTDDPGGISLFFRAHPWTFVSALKGMDKVAAPEALQAWNIHEWTLH